MHASHSRNMHCGLTVVQPNHGCSKWPQITQLPVHKLQMLDIDQELDAINGFTYHYLSSHNQTNFLKEIGHISMCREELRRDNETRRHPLIGNIIEPILPLVRNFRQWQTTSTDPRDTFETVRSKIDRPPCENHRHFPRMWSCYRAIAAFIIAQCPEGLQRLTDRQVIQSTNKSGSLGWQERLEFGNKYGTMREYIEDVDQWKCRVNELKQHLSMGVSKNGIFSMTPKTEVKESQRGRFIWSLGATGRIYENILFGNFDNLLRELPYCVSGIPPNDFGNTIDDIFTRISNPRAVCDDVSGWDTRVSFSMLCMEAEFLRLLTHDKQHKAEIRAMYRLYAYPLVWIDRPSSYSDDGQNRYDKVLYRLQGQVASGRRVTYSMNTVTNIVVTMCRAAYSQDIDESDMYIWTLSMLMSGHSELYGGKICGDDSVIIMSEENAKKYAKKGAKFMNEIGMPRKNKNPNQPSDIFERMQDINFCSHMYSLIELPTRSRRANLSMWVPRRSIGEILAKASIMKNHIEDRMMLVWARAQGLGLLVKYFHIAIVRLVALAILSATPNDLSFDCLPDKMRKRKPWIREGDVVDIINNCLFRGKIEGHRISNINELVAMRVILGRGETFDSRSATYINWQRSLLDIVEESRLPNQHYDDWISEAIIQVSEQEPIYAICCLAIAEERDETLDGTVIVDDRRIPVRRITLSACSPIFKSAFSRGRKEKVFEDEDGDAMEMIIDFANTSQLSITSTNVETLLATSTRLQVRRIRAGCLDYLERHLNGDNCAKMLNIAEKFSCVRLSKLTKEFIAENFDHVAIRDADLLTLKYSQLMDIIKCGKLNSPATTVSKAVMRWCTHDYLRFCNDRIELLPDLLEHVRWSQMDLHQFTNIFTHPLIKRNKRCREYIRRAAINMSSSNQSELSINMITMAQPGRRRCPASLYLFATDTSRAYVKRFNAHLNEWFDSIEPETLHSSRSSCECDPIIVPAQDVIYIMDRAINDRTGSIETYHPERGTVYEVSALKPYDGWSCTAVFHHNSLYFNDARTTDGIYESRFLKYSLGKKYKRWTRCTPMSSMQHRCELVSLNNYIYSIGGYSSSPPNFTRTVERYDSTTDQWRSIAPMGKLKIYVKAEALHGCIYVIGEDCAPMDEPFSFSGEKYNPQTDTWTCISSPPMMECGDIILSLNAFDGLLYALIRTDDLDDDDGEKHKLLAYNPDTDTWTVSRITLPDGINFHCLLAF